MNAKDLVKVWVVEAGVSIGSENFGIGSWDFGFPTDRPVKFGNSELGIQHSE